MRIDKINIYLADVGTFRPVIVELETDEGISGIGEAAVGFGQGCEAAAKMIEELSRKFVLGRVPSNISDIWNDFYFNTFWGKGAGTIFYAAVSAIEQALWDIKGKELGVPVYQLLGGKVREEIPVYANGWSGGKCASPQEFADKAQWVKEQGYDRMKLYPMGQLDPVRHLINHIKYRAVSEKIFAESLENVKRVREAVGPEVTLFVDVTAEGSTDVMWRFGQEIEPYNIYWYEEPADAFDIPACKKIHEKVNIPLAAGERMYTRYGFRDLIESRSVDVIQPDAGTCGGILESFKIASMAETHSLRYAPHNCGGPVLTAASLQLASCVPNFVVQEIFPFHVPAMYEIVEEAYEKQVKNGKIPVPTKAGLGVSLNKDMMTRYLVQSIY